MKTLSGKKSSLRNWIAFPPSSNTIKLLPENFIDEECVLRPNKICRRYCFMSIQNIWFIFMLHSNHYGAQVERGKNSILSKFKDLVLLPACNISFINFSQFQFDIKTLLVLGAEKIWLSALLSLDSCPRSNKDST